MFEASHICTDPHLSATQRSAAPGPATPGPGSRASSAPVDMKHIVGNTLRRGNVVMRVRGKMMGDVANLDQFLVRIDELQMLLVNFRANRHLCVLQQIDLRMAPASANLKLIICNELELGTSRHCAQPISQHNSAWHFFAPATCWKTDRLCLAEGTATDCPPIGERPKGGTVWKPLMRVRRSRSCHTMGAW